MDGDPCGGNLEIATTEVVRFFVSCFSVHSPAVVVRILISPPRRRSKFGPDLRNFAGV